MAWQFLQNGLGFIACWVGVKIAPIALALGAWRLAYGIGPSWLIHLLFLPAVLAAEWLGVRVLFFVSGDTGDGYGYVGLGAALILPIVILIVTLGCYYGALGVRFVSEAVASRKRG